MSDNRYKSIFEPININEDKSIDKSKETVNSFFDILKLRMGEYKEFKTEQKNQRAVESFQNLSANSEISQTLNNNTPFDKNVTLDETKYQL